MVTTPTYQQVEAFYNGQPVTNGDISQNDAEALIDAAVSMLTNLYSDTMLHRLEIADEDEAVKYLACHRWAITLGDTVSSESHAGGSVTYNVPPAVARSLKRTEYGAEFLEYLSSEPNVSFFSTT